jgi:hypothetical protein
MRRTACPLRQPVVADVLRERIQLELVDRHELRSGAKLDLLRRYADDVITQN